MLGKPKVSHKESPQEPTMAHKVRPLGGWGDGYERKNSDSSLLRSLVTYWPNDGKLSLGVLWGKMPVFLL